MPRLVTCVGVLLAVLWVGDARAQAPRVRFAAPASCPVNANCIPGFKRVYRVDPSPVYVPLKVADAGLQALDHGLAEVALAFASDPQLSRPDILTIAPHPRMHRLTRHP